MISPGFFIKKLQSLGTDFFTGVPDSLLKPLCAWMKDNLDTDANVIAANEGGAMALAAGHYLASGRPACIYMQNSGIGNAVNPLLSLLDADVYGIPALLVVGWRGMPGVHDEPQHVKQGRVTPELFEAMDIPYVILSDEENVAAEQIEATESTLAKELSVYRLQYRIVANKCKTQEIHSSAYRKYQLRWKGRLIQKTGCIEEKI